MLTPIPTNLTRLSVGLYGTPTIPGALLQLTATDGGLLLPTMTGNQAADIPVVVGQAGYVVYVTNSTPAPFTTPGIYYYTGAVWQKLSTGGASSLPFPGVIVTDSAGVASAVSRLVDTTGTLNNLSLGVTALLGNTTGTNNIAIGQDALMNNTDGLANVAIGALAMKSNVHGQNNVGIGLKALQNSALSAVAIGNTAVGASAMFTNTTGDRNTALGTAAGAGFAVVNNGTFLGSFADAASSGLTNVVAIGANSSVSTSNTMVLGGTGGNAVSVAVGATSATPSAVLALTSTTKGFLKPSLTTAQRTTLGTLPPVAGVEVYDNQTNIPYYWNGTTWVAESAGSLPGPGVIVTNGGGTPSAVSSLVDTGTNLALGLNAGSGGLHTVAVGDGALQVNSAIQNTAVGFNALNANTTAGSNTAVGHNAAVLNTLGNSLTVIGTNAMANNLTGSFDTALGNTALQANTDGSNNTALGFAAGLTNLHINQGTFVGASADATVDSLTNVTAIGRGAQVSTSNTMALGGPFGSSNEVKVVIGATASTPSALLALIPDPANPKGFLKPSLTTAQRTTLAALPPADGLEVYDNQTKLPYYWNATSAAWVAMSAGVVPTITSGHAGPLVGGTLTVASAAVTGSSAILLTNTSFGAGVVGILSISATVVGTSFTVTSSSPTDTSSFGWVIVN